MCLCYDDEMRRKSIVFASKGLCLHSIVFVLGCVCVALYCAGVQLCCHYVAFIVLGVCLRCIALCLCFAVALCYCVVILLWLGYSVVLS